MKVKISGSAWAVDLHQPRKDTVPDEVIDLFLAEALGGRDVAKRRYDLPSIGHSRPLHPAGLPRGIGALGLLHQSHR